MPETGWDPGTAAQKAFTSFVGPPIKVVPVSIAVRASLPVEIGIALPPAVRDVSDNSQKLDGIFDGILMNSILPWKKVELLPPRVNTPPGSSSCAVA